MSSFAYEVRKAATPYVSVNATEYIFLLEMKQG